jgi:potassium efflux system protein
MTDVLGAIRAVLNTKLFEIGTTPVSVSTLITVILILMATVILSRILRRAVARVLEGTRGGARAVGTVTGLLHYALLLAGLGVALQTVGIQLSTLFAAGALFAVAIGFAMQSITQNFVAGVILLSERSIKAGDVLEVEGTMVKVLEMGIRSVTAESRDGENLIIPNSVLVGSTVKNFTLAHSALRIKVPVGVVYHSDMRLVRRTLEQVAAAFTAERGVRDRAPQVFMTEFGDNSVNFEVAAWIGRPWEQRPLRSELCEQIWWAFQEQEITIAFPQLDVHFDPPVAKGLARAKSGAA